MRDSLSESLDDDGKLYGKWLNKRNNAKKEGVQFSLSYHEFCVLVQEANLVSSQLGFSGGGFVLARYGDCGGYSYGNCRFTTQQENMNERLERELKEGKRKVNVCRDCGKPLMWSSSTLCLKCYRKERSRNIPSKEVLSGLLKDCGFCEIGRMYGVSDNAVRKWCNKYGLPSNRRDLIEARKSSLI